MKQNSNNETKKVPTFSKLLDNNKFVFIFALLISIIIWTAVSMYQTPETDRVLNDVKVKINYDGSMPANNGLQIFGETEFYVDVTVRGKSYIVNESDFAEKYLNVTANLDGVYSAGEVSVPVSVALVGGMADNIDIVNVSNSSLDLYFDTYVENAFELTFELVKLDGYTDSEDYVIENEVALNGNTVTLAGPAQEINKITAVKAQVTLGKEPTMTESYAAEIIPVTSDNKALKYTAPKEEADISYKIPVYKYCTLKTVVTFTNMPKAYSQVDYTVTPQELNMLIDTAALDSTVSSSEISIANIDFSELSDSANSFNFSYTSDKYDLCDENREVCTSVDFTVNVNFSNSSFLYVSLPVENGDDSALQDNVVINDSVVSSVRVVGPASEIQSIQDSLIRYSEYTTNYTNRAYVSIATDEIDLSTYAPGNYDVPVKVYFRTLTGCWAYGDYTVNITVS